MNKDVWRDIRSKLFTVWCICITILAFPAALMLMVSGFWLIVALSCAVAPVFWIERLERKAGWVDNNGRWKD